MHPAKLSINYPKTELPYAVSKEAAGMHTTTTERSKPRKNMAQDLRNKDPTQESGEGNSQDTDEEKFQDFYTDSEEINWSRWKQDRGLQEENRTDKFPDMFEIYYQKFRHVCRKN